MINANDFFDTVMSNNGGWNNAASLNLNDEFAVTDADPLRSPL